MFVKGDWVREEQVTKRQLRRLRRRQKDYPKWITLPLMVASFAFLFTSLSQPGATVGGSPTRPLDVVLFVAFCTVVSAMAYAVLAPTERRSLRTKLYNEEKLITPDDAAYKLVMIEPIREAIVRNDSVRCEIEDFMFNTQHYVLKNNDPLYFFKPLEKDYWQQMTDPDGGDWLAMAGDLADCKDDLFAHIKRVEESWRLEMDAKLAKKEEAEKATLASTQAERNHHRACLGLDAA